MATFHSLEGVEGFRWGLFFTKQGQIMSSNDAPSQHSSEWPRIQQLLDLLPEDLGVLDLQFDLGRVLLRSGPEGRMVLMCDRVVKMTALNLMLSDLLQQSAALSDGTGFVDTDSRMSLVQKTSFGNKPVPNMVVKELLELLTKTLGPLAPRLAQFIARKRNINMDEVLEKDWPELLNALAGQIDDETKREKFLDAAVVLKNKT